MLHWLILSLLTYLALAGASPDAWSSASMSSTGIAPEGETLSIVAYPVDPSRSEQIAASEEALRELCGPDNVQREQKKEIKDLSWIITVTDPTTAARLSDVPYIRLDDTSREQSPLFTKRDDLVEYNVDPKNYKNDTETKAIYEFLKTKTDKPIGVLRLPSTGNILGFGRVPLDAAAKKEVEGFPGVKAVYEDDNIEFDRHLPDSYDKRAAKQSAEHTSAPEYAQSRINKREESVEWVKQSDAGWDLVIVSQPKEMDGEDLKDFVYDKKAGEGTWVYVIDSGTTLDVKNVEGKPEFLNKEPLQTKGSRDANEPEDVDNSDISHGTAVASKAVGRKYGVAKKATLVSVKMRKGPKTFDFIEALQTVIDDLVAKPDRQPKSVVISSMAINDKQAVRQKLILMYKDLFDIGVPFITSSGNKGETVANIDALPKLLEAPDRPIVNVGACDFERHKALYSQAGPHLTLYAPGGSSRKLITAQMKDGTEKKAQGTSYAAPIVAGVLATYLNRDPLPWDKDLKGKERVAAIKTYLASDASSWADVQGGEAGLAVSKVRTIWNGATREDHKEADANGVTAPKHSLNIIGALLDISDLTSIDWLFFETTPGGNVTCSDDSLISKSAPLNPNGLTYPGGTWDLTLEGLDCQYKNSGDNAGRLFCGKNEYDCHIYPRANEDVWKCFQFWRKLAITCDF